MVQQHSCNVIVDAGNTRTKIAVFEDSSVIDFNTFNNTDWQDLIEKLTRYKNTNSLLCSVLDDKKTEELIQVLQPKIIFSSKTKTPVNFSGYDSELSLGVDRKANSVAALNRIQTEYGLVIDLGTCIKFDLVRFNGTYLGGSISPGLNMRFKALSDNTGRLPYVKKIKDAQLVGRSTEDAITSGCFLGWKTEIEGFIQRYKSTYPDLTIFLTGGDMYLLDSLQKNGIFADENFTLRGLNLILAHNA